MHPSPYSDAQGRTTDTVREVVQRAAELATLDAVVRRAAAAAPAVTAIVACDATWTFADLAHRIDTLAGGLAAATPRGATVAVLGESSAAYVEALYAAPAAERRLLLLNFRHHPREWRAMLDRAGAVLVLGDSELLDRLADEAPGTEERLVAFGTDDHTALHDPTRHVPPPRPADRDAVAWIVPTSGTTGTPKLACLTHRSLLAAAEGCAIARPVAPDDVYLLAFPLCHVAAYNVVVQHLHARPLVLLRRFDPDAASNAIAEHRVTTASLAPTMIAALLDAPRDHDRLASLRAINYGSSGIAEPLLRRAMDELDCGFSQGYGMTELSGNCAYLSPEDHRRGLIDDPALLRSAGLPTPLVELRIVDDTGRAVAPGAVGEIAVRGEQVMAGYLDDDAATHDAIVDGWLRTGDLGRIDDGGRLFVVDRKKDVIVTGGENVASREVEAVLHDHPAVHDVAVVGIADDYYGEAVAAAVVLRPGHHATEDELVAHCRARLAGYKRPRHVVFVAELPRNTVGKVDKGRVRATLRGPVEVPD
jgi:acyl-CoA synthetase (AMP-forming)/AMP-acid ligase II